jgi:hypothetical protein
VIALNNLFLENLTLNNNLIPIFEISPNAPKYLNNLDNLFHNIKLNYSTNYIKKTIPKIQKELSLITGIKNIKLINLKKQETVFIYPEYNFDKLTKNNKGLMDESFNHVERIILAINFDLLFVKALLTPQEMTAIILHELGHLIQHRSKFSMYIFNKLRQIKLLINKVAYFPTLYFIMYIYSRPLSFFEHKQEYNCDKFAIKYGYGDELASAFVKFNPALFRNDKSRSRWAKIKELFKTIFNISPHPSDERRICQLMNGMKTEYMKDYPELNQHLEHKIQLLNC